jgi:hypothetical protein
MASLRVCEFQVVFDTSSTDKKILIKIKVVTYFAVVIL